MNAKKCVVCVCLCCFILLSWFSTCEGQELLSETTLDYGSGWSRLTSPAIGLRFSLILGRGYWPEQAEFLLNGGDYIWTQPGIITLGPDTDADWYDCVDCLTDGYNGGYQTYLGIVTQDGSQGGSGYAGWEEGFFQRNPDFMGYEIDYITLQVNEMSFDSIGNHSGIATWSVYGHLIPEPNAFLLISLGILTICHRGIRRS